MNIQEDKIAISSILRVQNIYFIDRKIDKNETVKFLTSKVYPQIADEVTEKYLMEKVLEVEKLNNVLETGFYIPHAKLSEIDRFYCALALLMNGFEDPESRIRVRACFLLLTPHKSGFFQKHLYILSRLSQIFTEEFIDRMVKLGRPRAVLNMIKSAE